MELAKLPKSLDVTTCSTVGMRDKIVDIMSVIWLTSLILNAWNNSSLAIKIVLVDSLPYHGEEMW